ncbi:Uncharacterized conserved protein, DUF2267 family [Salinimicrobium catena]|uniref:Uncharacterized conserved protein, DUF2267 family n=1 Tax=Salinimicrobium catena TaxID=390640 RepID=A0A1H5M280_9FLAO|nr:DUF2267 domain-containing protein [Salinimicrobium catena]SDL17659.1 Uncharacterized conserved protein, DUF2267 family [Salinimicrobium catena]SEE83425.1 Uncharacterized conserved protein, DUF2267 family [Salinimicrobium catena]
MATNLNFEKFAKDAHEYINFLAKELGHPDEKERVLIIWRAVMHCIRDRIHLGESMQLIAPLPMILKGIYVEDWKYSEHPPKKFHTIDEMKEEVKAIQRQYGEEDFPWNKSTEEIIAITIHSLKRFMHDEQLQQLKEQMPKELQELVS